MLPREAHRSSGDAVRAFAVGGLATSEELVRALTSHTPVGIFVSDASGACVYVNERWCELAGLSSDEALGDGWARALHPDDASRVLGDCAKAAGVSCNSLIEYRLQRPDGRVSSIQAFVSALRDRDGEISGWSSTCLDVTADARRERQQQAVAEFGLRRLSETDNDELTRDAVQTLAVGLEVEYASLLELQANGTALPLHFGYGWGPVAGEVATELDVMSPAAQALRASAPVLIDHPAGSPDLRGELLKAHDVASSAAVVVHGDEQPLGVLTAHSVRPHAFTQNDRVFLRGIANVLSAISRDISERKRSEAALRGSEARSRAMLESSLDAVITLDHEGAIVEFSPAAEVIFGHRREDILGRRMAEILIPPSLRERHEQGFVRLLATGKDRILGKRVELSALRADGSEFPIELTVNAVRIDGPPLFTGFVRDISAQREAERKQLELATIVSSSDDGIIGTSLDRVITSWNRGAERIYGYTAEEAVGRSVDFLVPPERADELAKMFERLRGGEGSRHFQTECPRKDGTRVDVSLTISPMTDAGGEITGTSTIARDITELREAEAQLRRSEARYRDLFENATDLIATVDLESRFTEVNTAFARALGYSREELIGQSLAKFVPQESHEPVQRALRGKLDHEVEATVYEHELIAKDGHRIPVEVASRLIVEDGRPVGTEAICRDVSERKRLEAQLRQAQKMEAIGKLAGAIAHDFNNLLTVINGNADRALGLDDVAEIKGSLGEVLKAGTTAGALTRQLLAFSRKQVLRPRVLELTEVLASVQEMLGRLLGENVPLETTIDPDLGRVRVDQTQIEQVLLNLAVNARDAMPSGGLLSVTATNAVVDAAYAATRIDLEPGDYVALTVTDRGLGMDEETQGRIFEPFFTTKSEGTGLGLATVYGIVKQSGGDISVSSEPGAGTTFRLLFPRVEAPPEKPEAPHAPAAVLTGTETILVVEDNELVRKLTADLLRSLGYTVETAGCPSEAVELVTNRREPLELIVSDVMLPGESGPELVGRLQRLHPGTRSIYTSGYAPDLATQRGGLAPDEPFLAKPFTCAELASLVRQVLDADRSGAQLETVGVTRAA